ncbi:hypothetical protein KAFR_0F00190 [Kazachstania africana CBS 2517]|uniref:Rab-GAP TBC domain-containing protein n=1 Tax=Kazachstania africana (strain ATCC 22294 / BCRC 22015 / CBS 2517 / CECT 1963 / NBRC 1671 / NRRL Y-8276) TaxID=1071382 RepID=H2AW66_KAZAF|nr:hypothetical protein KAFR_0F00190 [Kazachstania africana CBS 2517]CCF58616.1 hypothetical protein KAFR_0F00190 [Kazachstania africana CBS 2517]
MRTDLVFCKSKVFVHPTKNARDNFPGFLLITVAGTTDPQLLWIPESSLSVKQLQLLIEMDEKLITEQKPVEMDVSIIMESSGAFSSFRVSLPSLYCIEFRPPSPSGWWYGSMISHLKDTRGDSTLPVLFFHDDVCPSTLKKKKQLNKSFDPFTSSGDVYWGGIDVRDTVAKLVDLQKTKVDQTVWLVNPSLDDLRNFSASALKSTTDQENKSTEPISTGDDFWNKWESAKWSIMSHIANATSKSSTIMTNLIKSHPVVQLVERNKNSFYVQKLLKNPRVIEIQDDFDSARVYLAKWALGVKEEADNYQSMHRLNEHYQRILKNDLGFDMTSDVSFTQEELNKAMERNFPLNRQKWNSFFDSQGRLSLTVNEIKDYIFHGGISDMELRKEVWLFLMGVYPWDSSADERIQIQQSLKESYNEYKNKWLLKITSFDDEDDESEQEYWDDQIFRIEKDVKRNDRNLDIYKWNTPDGKKPEDDNEEAGSDTSEAEHWKIKNPNLIALKNILVTFNVFNSDLGYVQGMTDLLSPIYYILRDETMAYWCFVKFMERMERNFLRDQSGIRDQMLTMVELCQLMLPKLSEHLSKCDSSNLFFCFRMLLVWFKREFDFEDVCSIWEIFFTDFYSSQFQLFFMLAILQKNCDPVIQNLNQFDQVLKYFNDMHSTMNWKDLMIRSELLFIRFEKLMTIMERKSEFIPSHEETYTSGANIHQQELGDPTSELPWKSKRLQLLLSKSMIIQKEAPRTRGSIR